jgi:hypothetical protein
VWWGEDNAISEKLEAPEGELDKSQKEEHPALKFVPSLVKGRLKEVEFLSSNVNSILQGEVRG